MSTSQKSAPDMGKAVQIKQLLKERAAAVESYQTRTWVDEPVSTSCVVMRSDDDRDIPILVTVVTMKSGKVRNTGVALLGVLLATGLSYYVCWAVWTYAIYRRADDDSVSILGLVLHPDELIARVRLLNMIGVWKIKSLGERP